MVGLLIGRASRAIAPSCHEAEQFSAELVGGGSQHPLGFDAAVARRVQAKQVHHDVPNDGEVVGGESGAHGGLVFVELDVEAPVKPVFDLPVGCAPHDQFAWRPRAGS